MGPRHLSIFGHALLGLTLLVAASCVPSDRGGARISQAVPPPSPRKLLRDLALDVPDRLPLPALLKPSAQDDAAAAFVGAAPPFVGIARSDDDARRAIDCLTAAVYYEARSEAADGQRAVAQVVLNRVRDRAFPHSVCGVVFQGSQRRTGCQFSFTCDGSMAFRREAGAWGRARQVAAAALAGEVYAPVGSATFYHTSAVLPWWASSMARIGSIGAHIFYRWRGAMEGALAFRQRYAGVEPSRRAMSSSDTMAMTAASYRDSDDADGVTVHRGRQASIPIAATSATLAPTTPQAGAGLRTLVAGGVTIHRGRVAPHRAVVPAGTIVGEEIDPT